ncbi:unnamed protein product [Chrysoparadoxa australica]
MRPLSESMKGGLKKLQKRRSVDDMFLDISTRDGLTEALTAREVEMRNDISLLRFTDNEERIRLSTLLVQKKCPDKSVPEHCWVRKESEKLPSRKKHKPARPGALESLSLLPVGLRVGAYIRKERKAGRDPIFDLNGLTMDPPDPGPYGGVPLGGIGGGCIGRGFRGDFRRWNLWPGKYQHNTVMANQFSVRVKPTRCTQGNGSGSGCKAAVLSSLSPGVADEDEPLKGWGWGMSKESITYCALYPRAWQLFQDMKAVPGLRLACRQVSPVFPREYRESSLPVTCFVWTIENTGHEEVEASIMFTFQNGVGLANDRAGGHTNTSFAVQPERESTRGKVCGVQMAHKHRCSKVYEHGEENESHPHSLAQQFLCPGPGSNKAYSSAQTSFEDKLTFAIAAEERDGVSLTAAPCFGLAGATGGEAQKLWDTFAENGELSHHFKAQAQASATAAGDGRVGYMGDSVTSDEGETIGGALCQKVIIPAGSCQEVTFSLSWDMPMARFGGGLSLPRRYTKFFGREGKASPLLCEHALAFLPRWEQMIQDWQNPVLEDPHLPKFYKYTLFNELYFITDGGTLWLDSTNGKANEYVREPIVSDEGALLDAECHGHSSRIGQFLYLEGHEYLMYNTYDVHFYASFALAQLWPMLELSLQRDIGNSVGRQDSCWRTLLGEGHYAQRKAKDVVPHDLGSPSEEPWAKVNAYVFQDVSRWKDLGPKFVLQVYRDFVASASKPFLNDMWPKALEVMKSAESWDTDNDGLIENSGFPDQTFDIWTVKGPSAYTGGLWVAALSAMVRMSEILEVAGESVYYTDLYTRARASYKKRLWNGKYLNYDCSGSAHANSIMADQMAGQWYTRACGLQPVVEEKLARSCLRAVFENNVKKFGDGVLGAVNGMRPNGTIDNTCLQSREVWTGVTYGCAAAMLHEAAVALEGLPNTAAAPSLSPTRMYDLDPDGYDSARRQAARKQGQYLRVAAFETIRGLHESGWNDLGYWFNMPEGWEHSGNYRSLGYMRSLAIWSLQWAIEHENIIMRNMHVTALGMCCLIALAIMCCTFSLNLMP